MATSGTTTFDLDVAEAIEEAFEMCGLEARTGYDLKTARRSLNLMFAEWANKGLNLWTVEQGSFTTTADQTQQTLIAAMADVLDVYIQRDGTDYPLKRLSREQFVALPDKSSTGRPVNFWLDRQTIPVLNIWPAAENATDTIYYYYVRRIEDAGNYDKTLDLPFRFLPAMTAGLAVRIATKRAPQRLADLKAHYDEQFMLAAEEDEDRVSLIIRPQTGCG